MPPVPNQIGPPLHERSNASLRVWLVAFPVLGGIIVGIVAGQIWQRAADLTVGQWFSLVFTLVLGLLVIVLPPSIALRELRRRKLEQEEAEEEEADPTSPSR